MILDKLFTLMAEKNASDIFITAGVPIHIKIEGETLPINQQMMEPTMIRRMADEIMAPEQAVRFDKDKEMNLSFGRRDVGNFRVNLFWQRNSVAIVVRFIRGDIPTLDSLKLPEKLADIIMEKRGLVLVVGATGSGKSTTMASMIDHRNRNRTGHILTIEDPIEYLFKHRKSIINQREIGIDTHDWNEALRNAMRQAPDCILIGEIRDKDTMQAALAYAQTGHLCLATLHANNAYHALNRIVNFFPLENRPLLYLDLAVALKCIISQRLVRRPDGLRLPSVELLLNTRHVAELIERGEISSIKEAMEQTLAPGSQTFEQDLFRLYREKIITLDEALAHADSPTNLSWLINNSQISTDANDQPPQKRQHSGIIDFESTQPDGASFSEFTLNLEDR
ncbi:PilT/PilU family type 4a pilus ATPase [Denitromonas ohlonensis]|uniref:PilT/PilU family type 4a pilus ATPase n=2 Tax=Denitromonas TaxID=139331 RepID=A0A558CIC3_9RHOO|nr:PilT/PilU family type 4a pilus ATPase [Denitromonas ohlonensis]TVT48526.1 MAG: PilT/PilU family type 4a pilus ATPase [Denitromonas halophila]TVO69398.1 PilT/PilU family type 4a pilus ATPase [Denitromonas ohlonensis]TVO77498.1 PilT/PilU family type 4a pilus ATPase [Denitromonas ohlonensis]TVT73105.1 MAG: PilT/PilU family type 4a pilus ATPase [Denitromonas halophila]TVT74160.1 MAG: PilT/PilU family type 4a pilus ATPase [Denitromonas halophila]